MKKTLVILSLTACYFPLNAFAEICPTGDMLLFKHAGTSTSGTLYALGESTQLGKVVENITLNNSTPAPAFEQVILRGNGVTCFYNYQNQKFTLIASGNFSAVNTKAGNTWNNQKCKSPAGNPGECNFVAKPVTTKKP